MKLTFGATLAVVGLAVHSACAAVVWDLNPQKLNQPAPASSQVYTSQGYSITAYGFNNEGGIGTPQQLFFKNVGPINGAYETGLGVSNTFDQELQVNANGSPFDFIQFDLSSIIRAGATNGAVAVSSLQTGESFSIYGSNMLGTLGTQLGGTFGNSVDAQFVNIPNFGTYQYYSIVAAAGDVLPSAVRADFPAVPEMNALIPVTALVGAIGAAELVRRRKRLA